MDMDKFRETDIDNIREQIFELLDDAAEDDLTLDETVYHTGKAITAALVSILQQLKLIEDELAEIKQKLD